MRLVVATDSFKGSLRAREVASCLARGLREGLPAAEIVTLPLSDGGEGLLDSLVPALGGTILHRQVIGPLGEPVSAQLGWIPQRSLGIIEMASASGLELVPPERRNPWLTTSFGTGQLISSALDLGARRLVIGLGGSATNDGGAGMLQALGVKLLDGSGRDISPGAAGLLELQQIDTTDLDPRIAGTAVLVACDVDNPLLGPTGATAVFARQKGALAADISRLEAALGHFAQLAGAGVRWERGPVDPPIHRWPGAGAAGGLGFALAAFCGARLVPGAELVMSELGARSLFANADLIITGEGRLDSSSLHGKLPIAVAKLAAQVATPVVAVCGVVALPASLIQSVGIRAAYSLVDYAGSEAAAQSNSGMWLTKLGHELASEIREGRLIGDP